MRFFTGLHSERLSGLETELYQAIDTQRGKREAVRQIREFVARFELGSELDFVDQIANNERSLAEAEAQRRQLEEERAANTHPTDSLRERLRALGAEITDLLSAITSTEEAIAEQRALRAELITTRIKTDRVEKAGALLEGVDYARCPQCGTDISDRVQEPGVCGLCGSDTIPQPTLPNLEFEAIRRELNDRVDQIADSIERRERALGRSKRQLAQLQNEKIGLDDTLQKDLASYDSAFVENIRAVDRRIATLVEQRRFLERLREMPRAINDLEEEAGALQGTIDRLRSEIEEEKSRLHVADQNIVLLTEKFRSIMLSVGFPGVSEDDEIEIDPRNWRPVIRHEGQEWSFWDAGSGGKKTLFNVCYALAVHEAARDRGMPVPNVLIIDSPTKNISDDENPELVRSLYREIYRLASRSANDAIQFLLVDSNLVVPELDLPNFIGRHLAGNPEAPSLIPYYIGP
jgi:predicted Zn-ribbon and HTH transcriptional regulator